MHLNQGDTMKAMQAHEHREKQLDALITELSKRERVSAYSVPSRRETDILSFSLCGDRAAVLKLPSIIQEQLHNEDIEILQSGRRGIKYVLIIVVTERLSVQPLADSERRAKLFRKLERYLPKGHASQTPDFI